MTLYHKYKEWMDAGDTGIYSHWVLVEIRRRF